MLGVHIQAVVAECAGELAAEPGVFLCERLVALERGIEAGAQRGVACPLVGGDGAGGPVAACAA
jgi:hypothetical protein